MRNQSDDHQSFIDVLDGVPVGLAFYTAQGSLVHRNETLRRMLQQQKDDATVEQEIENAVMQACSHLPAATESDRKSLALDEFVPREIRFADQRYRLRVGFTRMELFGPGSSVIVTLDQDRDDLNLTDEMLSETFQLTSQEIRVARLLYIGHSNLEIAKQLHISPHTAKRHTEKVLRKLKAATRAQVPSILLNASAQAKNRSPGL